MKKILVIEDDSEMVLLLVESLKTSYEIVSAGAGSEGLRLYESEHPDMIILDLNLPDAEGLDICKEIRNKNRLIPIIMMSSRKEEVDRVLGLELGADDYITKPFSVRELRSRVNAFFRRIDAVVSVHTLEVTAEESVTSGRCWLMLDDLKRTVHIDGNYVHLTQTEYMLLRLLAGAPGRVFSRKDIISAIWGEEWAGTEAVMVQHFRRLRGKIEYNPKQPEYIQTVHGAGYRLDPQCDVVIS